MGRSLAGHWFGPLFRTGFEHIPRFCGPFVGWEESVQASALPFTPPISPPFPRVNSARKAGGNSLRAECGGQMSVCGFSRRFWVFVLEEQALRRQKRQTHRQRSRGCVQREVHVYCFLPRGKLPSVIDLFRAHHWKKNPGDNDYLPLALSRHRPNSSPSRSSPSGRGGE